MQNGMESALKTLTARARSEEGMLKKILWILMLLIMTACTILFKDGVNIVLGELTPTMVATSTPVDIGVEITPTETVEPTMEPTATEEPVNLPSPTIVTTAEPEPTPTPEATATPFVAVYEVQKGSPAYLDNFAHLSDGCAWQGIAGQVFNSKKEPVTNLVVKVSGEWNGKKIASVGVTGMVAGLPYGPGSYEIVLGDKAVNSNATLYVQLFDEGQKPLTEPIAVSTQADCQKNLVILNFVKK
jgi:hypothetical protein